MDWKKCGTFSCFSWPSPDIYHIDILRNPNEVVVRYHWRFRSAFSNKMSPTLKIIAIFSDCWRIFESKVARRRYHWRFRRDLRTKCLSTANIIAIFSDFCCFEIMPEMRDVLAKMRARLRDGWHLCITPHDGTNDNTSMQQQDSIVKNGACYVIEPYPLWRQPRRYPRRRPWKRQATRPSAGIGPSCIRSCIRAGRTGSIQTCNNRQILKRHGWIRTIMRQESSTHPSF